MTCIQKSDPTNDWILMNIWVSCLLGVSGFLFFVSLIQFV